MNISTKELFSITAFLLISSCSSDGVSPPSEIYDEGVDWSQTLRAQIDTSHGTESLILPNSDDYTAIPQDGKNPITKEKVSLGKLLFHDTGFALNGLSQDTGTWSCASCHHADAGFKAGIPQGIGEGGIGFGKGGTERVLADGFDANAELLAANKPDIQPVASPTVLNVAYQDVMLWNGQFGNAAGSVNNALPADVLAPDGTPKEVNTLQLSGVESQAIAGTDVHRLKFDTDTPLQTNSDYANLWIAAYGTDVLGDDVAHDAGLAIAAFERTVLANRAPFQRWLRGDATAMSEGQLRGVELFFGKAGCAECHQGPALSSRVGASADEIFFNIGFADLSESDSRVHGSVAEADSKGRGGFTQQAIDDYKFKVPQLYNLADTSVLGHGASFSSIKSIVEYKNKAIPQAENRSGTLDERFRRLELTDSEITDLTNFLENALYDPELERYQPESVPSGGCVVTDAMTSTTCSD